MAITHTETVTNLKVLNDGSDVVSEVTIEIVSVDDSDPTNLTTESHEMYSIDTVSYTHLTLPTILRV